MPATWAACSARLRWCFHLAVPVREVAMGYRLSHGGGALLLGCPCLSWWVPLLKLRGALCLLAITDDAVPLYRSHTWVVEAWPSRRSGVHPIRMG